MNSLLVLVAVSWLGAVLGDPYEDLIVSRWAVITDGNNLDDAIAKANVELAEVRRLIGVLNIDSHTNTANTVYSGAARGSDLKTFSRSTKNIYQRLDAKLTTLQRAARALELVESLVNELFESQPTLCDTNLDDPNVYQSPDGDCYYVGGEHISWDAARAACFAQRMDLAWILSNDEQVYIENSIVHARDDGSDEYWLGGRRDQFGTFVWFALEDVTVDSGYTHWHWGQPDNFWGQESCMSLWWGLQWNDYPCDNNKPYICKALQA